MSTAVVIGSSSVPLSLASGHCYLCGREGEPLYRSLSDRLWTVPGIWNFRRCPEAGCGLVWLDPCPVAEDIPLLYENYITHDHPTPRQEREERLRMRILESSWGLKHSPKPDLLGRFLSKIDFIREYAAGSILWISPEWKGELLDFGCGGCGLLKRMRSLGWEVCGVEPDPKALALARQQLALDVRSSLNDFPAAKFDVITLSHVIEHVPDPVATLKDCASRLRKGGRLIVATPNIKSWGHRYFGEKWVGLDPPRHLMLFSPRNLAQCAERAGLRIENLRTSSRSASFVWSWSHLIRRLGALRGVPAHSLEKIRSKLAGVVFQALEHSLLGKDAGEEIVLLARRD